MNVLLLKAWLAENSDVLLGARLREVRQVDAKSFALQLGEQWLLLSILEAYPTLAVLAAGSQLLNQDCAESGFVKSLRFQIANATLTSIEQEGFDRSVVFSFTRSDIYGRETMRSLRIELVGRASNAYLLNEKGVVISIFKHVPAGRNSVRRVVTGKPLPPPPALGKLIAERSTAADLEAALSTAAAANPGEPLRELLTRGVAGGDVHLWPELRELVPLELLLSELHGFVADLQGGRYNAQLFQLDARSANEATLQLWDQAKGGQSAPRERQEQGSGDSRSAQIRAQLELAQRAEELEAAALEMLKRTSSFASREKESAYLKGWQISNPEWAERIDMGKSAEENAGALIEYAQRLKRARPKLEEMLAGGVGAGPVPARNISESGRAGTGPAPTQDALARDIAKLERGGVKYLRYATSDGIAIIVGQSDRSNDELVRHYGSSRHLWLHVRDYPGSHVLLLTNGRDVPQRSLEEAAIIAGYYSKGRGETELDISYTPVKQLRRPKGGKPGQVLLVSEKVISVNPMRFEALRDALRVSSTSQ